MNTVTLGVKMNNIPVHAVLDSGAGCSVIDLGSVEKLGLSQNIIQASHKLIDASGNNMDIIGTITTVVNFNRMRPINYEFKVLNSKTYTNILSGRDLMKMYGTVTFDFSNYRVQLRRVWQNGLTINVRNKHVFKKVTIPARSEQTVLVRCTKKAAMLSVDFEPSQVSGVRGLFSSRARVTPNIEGIFQITMIKVTETDIKLKPRKIIGSIHPMSESIAFVECAAVSDNELPHSHPDLSNIQFGEI